MGIYSELKIFNVQKIKNKTEKYDGRAARHENPDSIIFPLLNKSDTKYYGSKYTIFHSCYSMYRDVSIFTVSGPACCSCCFRRSDDLLQHGT